MSIQRISAISYFSEISKTHISPLNECCNSLVLRCPFIRSGNEHPGEHGGRPVWHDWPSHIHQSR